MLKGVANRRDAEHAGVAAFASKLLENRWISRQDLSLAERHARREQMDLVDAVVALRFVGERDSYAALALAAGVEVVDLHEIESSELAVRLVPERLARRHSLVPVSVDNRLLTFATCRPMDAETEREIACASGSQARMVVDTRSNVLDRLDRCYSKTKAVERTGAPANRGAAYRVLVTDDDTITRMVVRMLLEKQQYEVVEATNGKDAIEIARREHPDLLLIDLNMPEMDGYEAVARLRRDMSFALLSIVVLTGEEGPAAEQRMIRLGIDDYLVKPFEPDVLVSRVNAVFRRLQVAAA